MGESVGVMCMIMNGQPPFKFEWQKDGRYLKDSSKINILEKASSLSIDPVLKSSAGNYTCSVTNSFGRNSFSAILRVKGAYLKIMFKECKTYNYIFIVSLITVNVCASTYLKIAL